MKITPEAVKERIAALESAGEISLKEQFYLEALRQLVASVGSYPVAFQPELANYPPAPVVSADLLHTAASAIEDLLTTKDRMGVYVCFDLPFRLRSAANAQPAPVVPELRVDWQENEFSAGWNACRAAMLQENPVCTCPSGDGSLRWPCPVHPGNSPIIPDSCTWHCEEDINNWHSDCGYQFQFMEGGPEDNGVNFCPKCGKSVAVSATEGTEE